MNLFGSHFTHVKRDDGTLESICRKCLATVAKARNAADLEDAEQQHSCTDPPPQPYVPPRGPLPGS